jgi:hypothetical protein
VVQGVLAPNYVLYRDSKGNVSYSVPHGTEIEVFRKVR